MQPNKFIVESFMANRRFRVFGIIVGFLLNNPLKPEIKKLKIYFTIHRKYTAYAL
jgi:hypothetical protein